VLSVIWFIGFGGYLWTGELERIDQSFGRYLELCSLSWHANTNSLHQRIAQDELAQKLAEEWAKYDECRARADRDFLEARQKARKDLPILLAVALGTVGFGWLVVWLGILIVRWVQRGFASV
jgi:hypothetical protein